MKAQIPQICWLLAAVLQVGWAARLWKDGLAKRYLVLFSFLVSSVIITLSSFILIELIPRGSDNTIYGWFWIITRPVGWTLLFCIIIEAYNRMLVDLKGFQRLGQLVMYGASGGVGVILIAMVLMDASADTWRRFWFLQEQGVYTALTILSLLLVLFGVFFRLPVPRNVRILFAVFGVLFATQASFRSVQGLFGDSAGEVRALIMPVVSVLCLLAGAVTFSKAGEEHRQTALRRPLDAQTERMMTSGLQGFNDVLLKVLRS